MTRDEILAAIAADPALQTKAAVWDHQGIADALSAGRVRYRPTEAGTGTILETIGLAAGNALIDALVADPQFRHIKPLLDRGGLRLDSPLVRGTLNALASGGVITQAQADVLIARATEPDPIPVQSVIEAIGVERREG